MSALREILSAMNKSAPAIYKRSNAIRIKKSKLKRKNRLLRKHIWDPMDMGIHLGKTMDYKETIFLGVSDVEDLVTAEILKRRIDNKQTTVQRDTTVLCNRETWQRWAEHEFSDYLYIQNNTSSGMIIEEETNNFIKFDVDSNSTTVRAYGDEAFAKSIIELITTNFSIVTSHIEWIYSSDGNSVSVPLNRDRLPVDEMYPFLNGEPLTDYYERYMKSSANILLLIGPPGTGKTTFIRGLLAHTNSSAIVSYDSNILDKDGFFARFIEDDASIMVLEDSDAFLKSRSDGNTMMHRFLNVGDGLVTTKGKKMIFSTNLPSIRDIDSALIRPGRCFDILEFKPLTLDQAKKLSKKLGGVVPVQASGEYSIAEIFNKSPANSAPRKVGFV